MDVTEYKVHILWRLASKLGTSTVDGMPEWEFAEIHEKTNKIQEL